MARSTPPPPPPITEAEWDVMDVLWGHAPATAQDVHGRLADRRDWTVGTVKTLLARLLKKGAVDHEVDGKRYLYSPRVSREECVRSESSGLIERVGRRGLSPLIAHFLEEGEWTADELAELRARIEDAQREEERS